MPNVGNQSKVSYTLSQLSLTAHYEYGVIGNGTNNITNHQPLQAGTQSDWFSVSASDKSFLRWTHFHRKVCQKLIFLIQNTDRYHGFNRQKYSEDKKKVYLLRCNVTVAAMQYRP